MITLTKNGFKMYFFFTFTHTSVGLTVVSVSRVVELFMRSLTELALSLGSGHEENLSKQQHWEVAKGSLRAARGPWLSSLSSSWGMPRLSSSLFRRPPVGWRPSVGPSSPSLKNSGIFNFPAQVSGQAWVNGLGKANISELKSQNESFVNSTLKKGTIKLTWAWH